MVRIHQQDFYVLEPTQLRDGRVWMPVRFFTRGRDTLAWGWSMVASSDHSGWIVAQDAPLEVRVNEFLSSFPILRETYSHHDLPDPCNILGPPPAFDTLEAEERDLEMQEPRNPPEARRKKRRRRDRGAWIRRSKRHDNDSCVPNTIRGRTIACNTSAFSVLAVLAVCESFCPWKM